jgi:hypothetical protein
VITNVSEEHTAYIFRAETLVTTYKTTRRHVPEDHNLEDVSKVFNWVCIKYKYLHLSSRCLISDILIFLWMFSDWIRVRWPGFDSLCFRLQTGSGAHPDSYPIGTGGPFPWDRAASTWTRPLVSKSRKSGAIPPLPHSLRGVVPGTWMFFGSSRFQCCYGDYFGCCEWQTSIVTDLFSGHSPGLLARFIILWKLLE